MGERHIPVMVLQTASQHVSYLASHAKCSNIWNKNTHNYEYLSIQRKHESGIDQQKKYSEKKTQERVNNVMYKKI